MRILSRIPAALRFPGTRLLTAALGAVFLSGAVSARTPGPVPGVFRTEHHDFRLVRVLEGLSYPWSLAFLSDGRMLITERGGRLLSVRDGAVMEVRGLPQLRAAGQGGLLDIAASPDFGTSRLVYFTYSKPGSGGAGTALARGRLEGTELRNVETIWEMERKTPAGQHFGSRIRFLPDGQLLLTTGDRGQGERAQDLGDDAGKVHRLSPDGTPPPDNPFRGNPAARPSIFSYGHRNPQGLAIHPRTGEPWLTEHGPQGGDEVNRVLPGRNYGWPVITYGRQYGSGARIGEGTRKPGMEQPLAHWTPSIAPSGLEFYTERAFPRWTGSLFAGSLAGQKLVRMAVDEASVLSQETVLDGQVGRIRDVRQGPDGFLYILTDGEAGSLYRLEPAD